VLLAVVVNAVAETVLGGKIFTKRRPVIRAKLKNVDRRTKGVEENEERGDTQRSALTGHKT
jgi:hypothetical protein